MTSLIPNTKSTAVFDSVAELAAEIGLSRSNTYKALNEKIIPSRRIGKRFIVPRAAVKRWLEETGTAQLPEAIR